MGKTELYLANLFNSLPRFFLHLPTVFFLTAPMIKSGAFLYVGLTFIASILQTFLVVFVGRMLLSSTDGADYIATPGQSNIGWRKALDKEFQTVEKTHRQGAAVHDPGVYPLFSFEQIWSIYPA